MFPTPTKARTIGANTEKEPLSFPPYRVSLDVPHEC
jgi:hypothetical protein